MGKPAKTGLAIIAGVLFVAVTIGIVRRWSGAAPAPPATVSDAQADGADSPDGDSGKMTKQPTIVQPKELPNDRQGQPASPARNGGWTGAAGKSRTDRGERSPAAAPPETIRPNLDRLSPDPGTPLRDSTEVLVEPLTRKPGHPLR